MAKSDSTPPNLSDKHIVRFWSKIDKAGPEECWLWHGFINDAGYGIFSVGPRQTRQRIRAHRLAYFLTIAIWPHEFTLHKCDVRACCNPAHLFLGNAGDNIRDCKQKGRNARGASHGFNKHPECRPVGMRHGMSKFTNADVDKIRELARSGLSYVVISKLTNASESHCSRIARRIARKQG